MDILYFIWNTLQCCTTKEQGVSFFIAHPTGFRVLQVLTPVYLNMNQKVLPERLSNDTTFPQNKLIF